MKWLTFLARRFVAGETAEAAVAAARTMNQRGIQGILDFLGEHVDTPQEAQAAVNEYLHLLKAIHQADIKASISLKASQMGLLFSSDVCLENLTTVAQQAEAYKLFIWMDMEGSALTQKTIDVFDRLRAKHANVGLCLQAYLVRTGEDLNRLMRAPLNVRLCKGAYKEPPEIAYPGKRAVDGSYRVLAQKLLEHIPQKTHPAFATHDRALIDEILAWVRANGVQPEQFEFQMLYGIQDRYLESLAKQGYNCHLYIPYGNAWLPYFIRRLRERKENVYFLLRNIWPM